MNAPTKVAELRTPRLILRDWRDSDLDAFAAMAEDPEVMEHLPPIADRMVSDGIAAWLRQNLAENGFGRWAVELPGEAGFIGLVGLVETGFEAHFTPAIEIGWRLARPYWGRGYAQEAAQAALDFGFGEIGFHDIVAYTTPDNLRSLQLMARLGMSHDPADDFDHPDLPEGDKMRRLVLYRLSCESWAERRRR